MAGLLPSAKVAPGTTVQRFSAQCVYQAKAPQQSSHLQQPYRVRHLDPTLGLPFSPGCALERYPLSRHLLRQWKGFTCPSCPSPHQSRLRGCGVGNSLGCSSLMRELGCRGWWGRGTHTPALEHVAWMEDGAGVHAAEVEALHTVGAHVDHKRHSRITPRC